MSTARTPRRYPFSRNRLELDPLYGAAAGGRAGVPGPVAVRPAWLATTTYEFSKVALGDPRFSREATLKGDNPREYPVDFTQVAESTLNMDPPKLGRYPGRVARAAARPGPPLRAAEGPDDEQLPRLIYGRFPCTAMTRRPAEIIASERMVKEQQVRWTPRGARLLLQVRTRVLNARLAGDVRRWYPGFTRCRIRRRSRRSLPALSRSAATAVACLPWQELEVYQGCGSTSLSHGRDAGMRKRHPLRRGDR